MRDFRVFFLLALFYLPAVGFCQESFLYHEINEIQTNEVIKGIVKDTTGFIWLATDQGVLKYDGTETALYHTDLPTPFTKKFLNTKNGRLLVLSDWRLHEIVELNDTVAFVPFRIGDHVFDERLNYPKSIYQDQQGDIWIGEVNAIVRINEKGMKRYALGADFQSISYHRTFSFGEDAFGHLWVAPFKGELLSFDREKDEFRRMHVKLPVSGLTGLHVVKGDYLLVGGQEGIFQLKIDSDRRILETKFIEEIQNVSDLAGSEENVFIGTWDNGLYHYSFGSEVIIKLEKVSFNDILDFYHDQDAGELWVAGSENIGLLSASVVAAPGEVGKYRVESMSMEGDNIYFSTGDNIGMMNLQKPTELSYLLESKNSYFDCVEADENELWIGDSFGAIYRYNLSTKKLLKLHDSTGYQAIRSIYNAPNGDVWFSGISDYLIKINEADDLVLHPEVNASNVVKESPDGQLFCGASGLEAVLFRYHQEERIFKPVPFGLDEASSNITVEDIAFSTEGDIYLATNVGLLSIDNDLKEPRKIQVPGASLDEPYKAVAFWNDILWLVSSQGLIAYNGVETILLTNENGLPSKIIKERGLKVHNGQLFIGTAKGLARINPGVDVFRETPRPIYKSLLINGGVPVFNDEGEVILPYKGRVQAEYIALAYPLGNLLYQTRIVGLEKEWSAPSSNRFVSLLGFSEGDYRLEVRAKDIGYLWSEPVSFSFTVGRPWFREWWAYLLFALVTIGFVGLVIRIHNYRLILQKRKLKQIIELRTEEINRQKNEIIEQKNRIIQQKEELIEKNNAYHKSQQALSEADLNFLQLKEKQLRDQIEYRNKQITTHTLNIIQKNETLKDLRSKLEGLIKSADKASQAELKKTLKIIDESFKLDKDWEEFKLFFEQIYTGFYTKLKINCPALTNQELRHCALIRLNLSLPECASILGISPDSVKVSRARIRKKLDLEAGQGLTDFILSV